MTLEYSRVVASESSWTVGRRHFESMKAKIWWHRERSGKSVVLESCEGMRIVDCALGR
jgi:hypothetical protein